MPVSREIARRWEREQTYLMRSPGLNLPAAVKTSIIEYFVNARIKTWADHLTDYFNSLQEEQDNNTHEDKSSPSSPSASLSSSSSSSSSTTDFHTALAACRRTRVGTEFHGFLDLPREIRDQIYRHVLERGKFAVPNRRATPLEAQTRHQAWKVDFWRRETGEPLLRYADDSLFGHGLFTDEFFVPGSKHSPLDRPPPSISSSPYQDRPLGLLQGVSSTIHAEAAAVFFAHNQIILPAGRWRHPVDFREARMFVDVSVQAARVPSGAHPFPIIDYALLARDVSYTFDMRDAELKDRDVLHYCRAVKEQVDGQTITPREALALLHDQKALALEIMWAERIDAIKQMTLDRLQLCFDDCYCPVGCCRKVSWVLERFLDSGPLPGFDAHDQGHVYSMLNWAQRPPRVVEVMGWVTRAEKEAIRGLLCRLPGADEVEVRFLGYARRHGVEGFLNDGFGFDDLNSETDD